jgi:lipopolysaccharide/colanic/teichoic acid biosynthesis glycosyltransferase
MSIVGPRPILREEDVDVEKANRSRFIAKPGLTGLWQVSGRKEVLWDARMKQDILYIETWSFVNDLLLIMRTFGTIISGKGAM